MHSTYDNMPFDTIVVTPILIVLMHSFVDQLSEFLDVSVS